jgi:long-chain acyl-CoA synthetase
LNRTTLTIHGLLEKWAMETPDKIALHDSDSSLTYAQWHRASEHLASRLHTAGVEKGTLVGVQVDRTCSLPVAFTAVSKVGARFLGLNPSWLSEDREMVFTRWNKRFILCWEGLEIEGWKASTLLHFGRSDISSPALFLQGSSRVDTFDEFYMNVTSGSTGLPKVAVTSHREILINTAAVCENLGLTGNDVLMSFFGVIGHPHEIFMRGLYLGATTVLDPSVYPRQHISMIGKHRVTFLMGLPPQLDALSRLASRDDADVSSLRIVEAGGMRVTERFLSSFEERTGEKVTPVWGSTETSGVVLIGEPGITGFSSVAFGYSVQLRDDDGEIVEENGKGELWISGEGIVNRYLGERADSSEILIDGWYRTGDIFTRRNGRLYFTGRRGGLIKASGLKVYPSEVELAILKHPLVRDVCVVGKNFPGRGEAPVAYIAVPGGVELTRHELRGFLSDILEDFKIPRKFFFSNSLPRTATGKLDRARIARQDIAPDYRAELLRLDVDLVKLLNTRAELMDRIDAGYNPNWVEEQINNAMGHNPGPLSDSSIREVIRSIMNNLGRT